MISNGNVNFAIIFNSIWRISNVSCQFNKFTITIVDCNVVNINSYFRFTDNNFIFKFKCFIFKCIIFIATCISNGYIIITHIIISHVNWNLEFSINDGNIVIFNISYSDIYLSVPFNTKTIINNTTINSN